MESYYRKFYTLNLPDEATSSHLGLDYITARDKEARGPVQVSYTGATQDPLIKAWVDTFKGLNHGINGNPYSCDSIGGYTNAATVDLSSGTRSYAATAYYVPAAQRTNLTILTGAEVEKIGFAYESGDKLANAVYFRQDGSSTMVTVNKEVILAAGTYQSPKILELSGIGNPQILKSLGIPIKVENPNVGENLQDHLMTGISFEVRDGVVTGDSLLRHESEAVAQASEFYQSQRAGPMIVGGIASHAFMTLPRSTIASANAQPSLEQLLQQHPANSLKETHHDRVSEILLAPNEAIGALLLFPAQTNLHNTDPEVKSFVSNLQPGSFITLGVMQSSVFSRGSSHIASATLSSPPQINPQYLSHPLDLELFARLVQYLETLAVSPPLSSFLKPMGEGKRNYHTAYVSDLDAAKDYIRTTAISSYHPCGTCAMLPREQGGVVSNRLMVYGTGNVRVVDASIMPLIPRGNLQWSVYAVAERAADIIKEDWSIG